MRPLRIVQCPECQVLTRPADDHVVITPKGRQEHCPHCGADFLNPHEDPYELMRPRLRCVLGLHDWGLLFSGLGGTSFRCEWCGAERLRA